VRRSAPLFAAALLLAAPAREARAWTAPLMESLARDARRLLPKSLAALMAEREPQILEELRRFPPELARALGGDLARGELSAETLAGLDAETRAALALFRERRVSDGVVRLATLLRVPADLSDPVLSVGADGYPPGVTREYYAFVEGSLSKIPVVLDDAGALRLDRKGLPAYWGRILARSRSQSPVIRSELFQNGRLIDHRTIDYRSPVFGVASLSYSRAVTAIAATWLAVWREARGDLTRAPAQREVEPREPPPRLPPEARTPAGGPVR
jgi:hypothetical protein